MTSTHDIVLTGFADEAAEDKTADQQFAVFAALGLTHVSLRFVDVGNGIRNVIDLDERELDTLQNRLDQYGLQVSSIGSPIGKVKLLNVDDGTRNSYIPDSEYLDDHVKRTCNVANRLNTRLVRGFSFYHPRGDEPEAHVGEASRRIAKICNVCRDHGLAYGLEVEANLVGQNADTLLSIHEQVSNESLVLVFDGANLVTQGYTEQEIIEQFRRMVPALGWIHIKDYRDGRISGKQEYVDEEALSCFVPAGQGDSGYPQILTEMKTALPGIKSRLKRLGIDHVFADLEPHLKGGGQFGGFSGPDGFGVATRAFRTLCGQVGLAYPVRDFQSINA